MSIHRIPIDLTGKKFGKLTVIKYSHYEKVNNFWLCKCDCENDFTLSTRRLNFDAVSCRCRHREVFRELGKNKFKGDGIYGFNQLKHSYKKSAKNRDLGFTLTDEDFRELVENKCFYCDQSPSREIGYYRNNRKTTAETAEKAKFICNGIDRLDNNLGYTIDNCVSCCKNCNFAKKELGFKDFIELVNRIAKKHPL